jgi:hypothetical protein
MLRFMFMAGQSANIFSFVGNQHSFFSANLAVGTTQMLTMALYWLDDSGPVSYYKLVSQVDSEYGRSLSVAWELPEDGVYYLAIQCGYFIEDNPYSLAVNYRLSDIDLRAALGGSLPSAMSYVSNYIGHNNNFLGYNDPKQLVYVNFTGGVTDKLLSDMNTPVTVGAFTFADIDATLRGLEGQFIDGVMQYVIEIFSSVPADLWAMGWNVQLIDGVGFTWSDYANATNGLFFTTIDPSTMGYSSMTDYTTIFVGSADLWEFGMSPDSGVLGLGQIDRSNMNKANNAIVFAQSYYNLATAGSLMGRLDQYINAMGQCVAHELGHTLGLNHQPTGPSDWFDPYEVENFNLLRSDFVFGELWAPGRGLMAYGFMDQYMTRGWYLGTASSQDFIGHIDTLTMLYWWLT